MASAHGFGERVDLPVPFQLYALGAGITVAVSFVFIGILTSAKKVEDFPHTNLLQDPFFTWLLTSSGPRTALRAGILGLTTLLIYAGLTGSTVPSYNIGPTVVWVLFTVGMVYVSAFFGNVWPVIQPAAILYDWLPLPRRELHWPEKLAAWPAVGSYFFYRWIENVSGFGSYPDSLAWLLLAYIIVSLFGMLLFDKHTWLRHADPFAVFFRFLSYFSITQIDDTGTKRKIWLRLPAVGLLQVERLHVSEIVFEMLMLSTIAYDGMRGTPAWQPVQDMLHGIGLGPMLVGTLGMLLFLLGFVATYFGFCWLMNLVTKRSYNMKIMASAFGFSMLPIAVAYELAHFISYFLIESQRIVYLISDPLGTGADFFGTAKYEVQYSFINYTYLWNFQVAIVIIGHVLAVYIAHVRSLTMFHGRTDAVRSQYPMLALMVFYTMFSLWVLGQPLIAE